MNQLLWRGETAVSATFSCLHVFVSRQVFCFLVLSRDDCGVGTFRYPNRNSPMLTLKHVDVTQGEGETQSRWEAAPRAEKDGCALTFLNTRLPGSTPFMHYPGMRV